MNEEAFLQKRKQSWMTLMELCDRADRSPTDLTKDQLIQLFRLYRTISNDLAVARTISTSPSLITYLNDLTARAYSVVYRQPRQSIKRVLVEAVRLSAQTVRRRRFFVLSSGLVFFGSGLVVFALCTWSPAVHSYFASNMGGAVFDQWKSGHFPERTGSTSGMMTGFYASNNPKVAITTGAIGAGSFGFLSVFFLLINGAIIGSLASEMAGVGKLGFLLSSITPHGVPEISGCIFSGASGLLLGWALINPGRVTRGESLRIAGKDAITLLATSVAMMFIAAPIEGYFSFNGNIPSWFKALVAIVTLGIWIFFWTTFARDSDPVVTPETPISYE